MDRDQMMEFIEMVMIIDLIVFGVFATLAFNNPCKEFIIPAVVTGINAGMLRYIRNWLFYRR